MLQIGATLQEARSALGLELAEVSAATMIRAKQLAALEAERFDEFPADAYARSFLREYADFLGLNSQLLLEEFDARLEDFGARLGEREPAPLMLLPQRRPRRPRWGLLVLVACALAAALIAWHPGGGRRPESLSSNHGAPPAATRSAPHAARVKTPSIAGLPRLVLVASRGACWLSVHADSASGPMLYEDTLQPASSLHFVRRRLWIRIGAPRNLELRLDGRAVALPSSPGPLNVVVTKAGVRAL